MKTISAGIVITDNNQNILLGHSTGNNYWDIPKGVVEPEEDYKTAAIRETIEEFGLDFSADSCIMVDIGKYEYIRTKDLYLFVLVLDKLPDPKSCKCTSFFNRHGREHPEIDDYKIISLDRCSEITTAKMGFVINKIREEHKLW